MEAITCDVLIVGAGMAGLTASAYLSKAGLKVILCEKEKKTGGLVNSFEHQGFVFDGGIRAIEDSGIVAPMLRQLGIEVEFLPNPVTIGIGQDVVRVNSKDSLADYQALLERHFPASRADIAAILAEIRQIMGYMDILYGIDNPLFLDLKNDPQYVFRTILPWAFKYMLTMSKINRLNQPVDEYLAGFSKCQPLIDTIAQHFFQKTPTFFALSYFSLYLDYRYPKGGTGSLSQALDAFSRAHGAEIRPETEIVRVDPGRKQALDGRGNCYQYRKLLWAADLKTLYRLADLASLADPRARRRIETRRQTLANKVGGDSVFTLYLTANLEPAYFDKIASAHFFYTPSTGGLAKARLDELFNPDRSRPDRFIADRSRIEAWLQRYIELTTYEISVPAMRDPSLAPAGQTGLIISTLFEYSLTKHIQSLGWYDAFKQQMAARMIDVLDGSIFPGLKAAVSDRFTSTPLTIERYSGNSEGAITGWAFTNDSMPAVSELIKVSTSVRTPLPDIYQAGQWTYSPAGLPISILTGKLAADQILTGLK